MTTTVVDRLIVTLGLDPRDFSRGSKEAATQLVQLKGTAREAGREIDNSMGAALMAATKRLVTIAVVLKTVKAASSFIMDASRATRELGNDSRAYDIAAARLRNLQNVAEMFGGAAEDVTRTVSGLQRAIFNLTFNGQMSEQLVMLGRLGVKFQDASGHARDFKDIYLDTATAIQQARASGSMTEGEAFQYLQGAGFDRGLSLAAVEGRGSARAALERQEQRRQVSGEDVGRATRIEQAVTSAGQAKDAAGVAALRKVENSIVVGATATEDALTRPAGAAMDALTGFTDRVKETSSALFEWTLRVGGRGRGRANYEGTIQAAAKQYGLNPETLAGLLNTESGFDPSARSGAGAVGIAQLMPQYFPGAGVDANADIYTAAHHLRTLHDNFVRRGDADDDGAWFLALQAYNAGSARVIGSGNGGKPLAQETLDYPQRVLGYAESVSGSGSGGRGGGNVTQVDIGQITVNTQATDADGMARDTDGALRRKMMASHAETGQN